MAARDWWCGSSEDHTSHRHMAPMTPEHADWCCVGMHNPFGPPMTCCTCGAVPQSLAEMRSYEGKHVQITLDYDDPAARVEGHLLYITDDGQVAYVHEDKTMYGWPCLAVKETP